MNRWLTAGLAALSLPLLAHAQLHLRLPASATPEGLPDGWVETFIDGGVRTVSASSLSYSAGSGQWTIDHTGGEVWNTQDSFRTALYSLSGDATFEACVLTHDQDGTPQFPKTGIGIRETSGATSAHAYVNLIGSTGTRITRRGTTGGASSNVYGDTTPVLLPECFRVEVDADTTVYRILSANFQGESYVELYRSTETWLSGTYHFEFVSTPNDANDDGLSTRSVFDNVSVDTGSVDLSSPQTVGFSPPSVELNVDEDAGSVTVTAQRNGDGSGACSLNYVVNDGTAVAGTDYTDESGTLSWSDAEVGEKTEAIAIIDRAANNGSRNFTVVLTKNSCANDALTNDTATITIDDADTGTALSWEAQGDAMCPSARETYYPGWRGFAACTRGGFVSGTTIYFITTLNATGAGSISGFAAAPCPKVGVFTLSGTIDMDGSNLNLGTCDEWSLVGETAPSPGVWVRDVQLQTRSANGVISHLTIGHGDQEVIGDGDVVQLGQGTGDDFIGLANVTLYWGLDETTHCYPGGTANAVDRVSTWQTAVINPLHDSIHPNGLHSMGAITNQRCTRYDVNRSMFVNVRARVPIQTRAPLSAAANNVAYNGGHGSYGIWYQNHNLDENSAQSGAPVSSQSNVEGNLFIHGPDTTVNSERSAFVCSDRACPISLSSALWSVSSEFYEDANSATWHDCSSGGCIYAPGSRSDQIVGSRIAAAWPDGLVLETFTPGNSSSELSFIGQIKDHVGARPADRHAHTEARLQYAVDGYSNHTEGGLVNSVSGDGGWPSLAANQVDHSDAQDTHCGDAIPTDSSKDDVMTSGLTRLHEWAISCADAWMPPGWRPDSLQLYGAP